MKPFIAMKIFYIMMAISAIMLSECGTPKGGDHTHDANGAHPSSEATHTHDDGTVHDDHTDSTDHHQEEFKVEGDSTIVKKQPEHGHSHDDGSHRH